MLRKMIILFILLLFPLKSEKTCTIISTTIYLPEIIITYPKKTIYNDLELLQDSFRIKIDSFLIECKFKGIDIYVVETYRTPHRQDSLLYLRRSTLEGGRSKHQYGLAIDVVPLVNGKPTWYNKKLWNKIGKIGESYHLRWGGRWRFYDPNHFEYIN